jgi:perosamine synthetase
LKIELDAPNIGNLEKRYVEKCLDSSFVSTYGPFVPEFERKFAEYLGVQNAVSTQSGTAAIHMSIYELGIGPGDEVIVPVLTFVATVNPVMYVGATPVFVDVDPKTWNIDPKEVKKAITPKTKAIIPVHLYGNPSDMDALMDISNRYGIPIIEDATESLGAKFKGKYTGTFGKFGCFSFNGNKIITTGGGGMIVTDDEKAAKHIRFLINQARDTGKGYYHPEIGFNYRMTNLEASLGLAQFHRLDEFLEKKRKFREIYEEVLSDLKGLQFQKEYEGAESSWWLTSILLEDNIPISVEKLREELKRRGIPTRRIFIPIVEFPPYRKFAKGEYKNAYRIYKRGLNLPSSTVNSYESIRMVAEQIVRITRNA